MHGRTILGCFLLISGASMMLLGCGGESDSGTDTDSSNAAAQDGPPLGDFQDDYELMLARLDLSAEESAALKAAWQKHLDQLEGWWAQHGAALVKHEAEMKRAAKDRDLSAVKAATAKAGPLREAFRALGRAGELEVVMALPPDQRKAWDAEQLLIKLEGLVAGSIALSPEQEASVQALAQKYAGNADPDLSVQNRLAQPFLDFERDLESNVMTPEQRAVYAQIKDKNKFRSLRW